MPVEDEHAQPQVDWLPKGYVCLVEGFGEKE